MTILDTIGSVGPKYVQIYQLYRGHIINGKLAPGEYLPTETQLAEEFSVSVGTIKRALGKLTDDGLLRRCRGRGSQVCAIPDDLSGNSRPADVLVLLGDLSRSFFSQIYGGILEELADSRYQPILRQTSNRAEIERQILTEYGGSVAGAIIAPHSSEQNYAAYGRLLAENIPVVFIDRVLPRLNVDAVTADDEAGGYLATCHLTALGHRRIALIGSLRATSMRQRYKGYCRALQEADLPVDETLICTPDDGGYDGGYDVTGDLLAARPDVTAIFASRDDAAWGAMQRLADLGISVPAQVSVVGFGDEQELCLRLRPRLTSVYQPKKTLGRQAARLLLKRLNATVPTDAEARGMALPVELRARESATRVGKRRWIDLGPREAGMRPPPPTPPLRAPALLDGPALLPAAILPGQSPPKADQ